MAKIEKEVQQFVHSYNTKKGLRWRAVVPDGKGGQIRQQGFIEKSFALEFSKITFQRVLLQTETTNFSHYAKMTFAEYSKLWLDQKQRPGLVKSS